MGMDDRLSAILENPGFQNIAGAIRRATRNAMYAKLAKNRKGYKYEVRYGLAQELKRKALYKTEFAAAIASFITEYMAENYRAAERGQSQRPPITTDDLEQVIALMDTHDSETVAMLLIAYGYAKEPKDPDETKPEDPENPAESDDNNDADGGDEP